MTSRALRWLCLLLGIVLVTSLLAVAPTADAKPRRPAPSTTTKPSLPTETTATGLTCPNDDPDLDYLCPIGPTYTLPGLTDLNGWTEPERSLLYGDLDGDGIDELVARGRTGLEVYRFDSTLGQWSQVRIDATILSDHDGWNQPKYGSTIQLGDVDGNGKAEVVARGSAGIGVAAYAWDQATNVGTWTWLSQEGPLSNSEGYDEQQYYESIQLVPLGSTAGSTRVNLMARGSDGLSLYRYESGTWQKSAANPTFGDDAGWYEPQYYSTIFAWDATTLVARAGNGLFTVTFTPGTGTGADWGSWAAPTPSAASGVWTDAKGWAQAQYYSTVTPLRGHGTQITLAARVPGGIGTATRQADGSWTANPIATGDDSIWSLPRHYSTAQSGDINGDGADEFLVRGQDGMLTYTLDATTGRFAGPVSANVPALSDAAWSDASRYGTIATAQLEKGKGRALLARGGHGIRTWRFDTTSNTFIRYQPYGNFPFTDPNDPNYQNRLKALDTMQDQLHLSIPVRQTFTDPRNDNSTEKLNGYMTNIIAMCNGQPLSENPNKYASCTPPAESGISTEIWTAVSNQLIAELYSASNVVDHFNAIDTLQQQIFVDQDGQLPATVAALKLDRSAATVATPPPADASEMEGLYSSFVQLVVAPIAVIPELEPLAFVLNITSASLSIAAAATPRSSPDQAGGDRFAKTYAEILATMTENQEELETQIASHRHDVLADYGLLATVGHLAGSQTWTLDQEAGASAGRQAFETWIYQKFVPVLWDYWQVRECQTWDQPIFAGYATYIPACTIPAADAAVVLSPQRAFHGFLPRSQPCSPSPHPRPTIWWWDCAFVGLSQSGYQDAVTALFGPVSASCTYDGSGDDHAWRYGCNLGFSIEAVSAWDNIWQHGCTWDTPLPRRNDNHPGGQCNGVQPQSLVTGSANLRGQQAGQVTMTLRQPVPKNFDLRRAKVHLEEVLHESEVGEELVNHSSGDDAFPASATVARGATANRAQFTIKPKQAKKKHGNKATRTGTVHGTLRTHQGNLELKLRIDLAAFDQPRTCADDGLAHLNTHLVVADTRKRQHAQFLAISPWSCVDPPGPRPLSQLTYRAQRGPIKVGR